MMVGVRPVAPLRRITTIGTLVPSLLIASVRIAAMPCAPPHTCEPMPGAVSLPPATWKAVSPCAQPVRAKLIPPPSASGASP
jgi:hypothetical protein